MKKYLGIDIGGTNTKIGIVDENGVVLSHTQFKTLGEKSFDLFFDTLIQKVESLNSSFEAIGVCAPNYNHKSGCIENPPNLSWGTINLREAFNENFKSPVHLSNDANAAALGEKVWGAGKELTDFIVITIGTGIGTGLYLNDDIYTGHRGLSGEGGHMPVSVKYNMNCACGGVNHLECFCSVRGIKRHYAELTQEGGVSFRVICEEFENNEKTASEVIDVAADYLSVGLAQMSSLLDPQKIIIAGGGAHLGERFLDLLRKKISMYSFQNQSIELELSNISILHGATSSAAALAFFKEK